MMDPIWIPFAIGASVCSHSQKNNKTMFFYCIVLNLKHENECCVCPAMDWQFIQGVFPAIGLMCYLNKKDFC